MKLNIATCAFEVSRNAGETQIFPDGNFRSIDGRPSDVDHWFIDPLKTQDLVKTKRNLVIDYEHQTLNSQINGKPAPAAGWFKEIKYKEGSGFFITPEWTANAARMISESEYKFISPVFRYNSDTGEILQVLHAALTNDPAIDDMQAVSLKSMIDPEEGDRAMAFLESVAAALGMPETSSEEDLLKEIRILKEKTTKDAKDDSSDTPPEAMKQQDPDPAKFVPMVVFQELQSTVTALKTKQAEYDAAEVDKLVEDAMEDGRIIGDKAKEHWLKVGRQSIEALRNYLAVATSIEALKGMQTDRKNFKSQSDGDADYAARWDQMFKQVIGVKK